jgi:hypothetical protein
MYDMLNEQYDFDESVIKIKPRNVNSALVNFTLCLLIVNMALLNAINSITNAIGIKGIWDTTVFYMFVFIMLAFSLFDIIINNQKKHFDIYLLVVVFIALFAVSYLMQPEIIDYLSLSISATSSMVNNSFFSWFIAISAYALTRNLVNYKQFLQYLFIFSIVTVFLALINYLIDPNMATGNLMYMPFSYDILLPTCTLFIGFFQKKNKLFLIGALTGLILIFISGARGALVSLILVLIMYFMFNRKMFIKSLVIIFSIIAFLLLCFSLGLFDKIFQSLLNNNIESRTIEKILNGEFFDSNNRFAIYIETIQKLNIFGHGIFTDRVYLGGYVHNFYLEILYDFGIFIGTALAILFTILIIKGIKSNKKILSLLIIITLSTGFFKLMLSGSYLNGEIGFYCLLALCINNIKLNNQKEEKFKSRYIK